MLKGELIMLEEITFREIRKDRQIGHLCIEIPQEMLRCLTSHLLRLLLLMWKGREVPCVFCKGDHFNDECKNFKSLAERKQKLLTLGRYFLCFKV